MGPISMVFPNPAVKILEERLWQKATKRYLREHPADVRDDTRTVTEKVKTAYKDMVGAAVEEAEGKIRDRWAEFKQVMTEELKAALATVLHMSCVEWYSVEAGQLPDPRIIAVPYQLLKRIAAELIPQMLRKRIDFENLDDATLEALASYATDQKFHDVLEEARRRGERLRIGTGAAQFAIIQIMERDPYFLGEDQHHSFVDMVLLSRASTGSADAERNNPRSAFKKSFDEDLKNRRDDRRFTGDGWEIEPEELKSWAVRP